MLGVNKWSPHRALVVPGRYVEQIAGELQTIVAEMHQVTRCHSPGVRANPREDDTHDNQQRDLTPAAPELRRMHQSEKRSGNRDPGGNACPPSDHRIQKASKNSFLHERSNQHTENAEKQYANPRLEQLLDGQRTLRIQEPANK